MGQAESQPQLDQAVKTGVAFHVLRVAERSPAASAGIDPFFDFICGVNGQPLGEDIDTLTDVLERSEGRQIYLQVYSTKRKELRDVPLIPSRTWSAGTSPSDAQPSLIGLSLRLCNPQHALEQVWHVLEILEGSPAQSAGLVPFGDWIVGYAGGILRGEGDFYDVVEAHVDKPLRLFVYNADYDVTREAILVPNRSWGGEGLLGCGVGYGLLHRIPKPQDRASRPPEEDDQEEEDQETTHPHQQHSHAHPHEHEYEEDLRTDGFGHEDQEEEDEEEPYPRSTRPREQLRYSGYDEATYIHGVGGSGLGEYDASEGVQVVPVAEEEEEEVDYSGFAPADSFAQATQMQIVSPPPGKGRELPSRDSYESSRGYFPPPQGKRSSMGYEPRQVEVVSEE
ncbi:GRASP55/65 PDZ-like domain-domain-containing protein [Leucosporidium creatinivorum]|uniref:GRASP55/65 PDZ-like domain-domain-containing protein n=1 Tax=Leucosporidium creatinivorum TaxID=106004 RepID=A0A1Y2DBZ8_9BASI|nr:GRASP55/65 PDZ-like domain-domain-containing protein [Leucosporidium creatinivorum]